MISTKEVFIVGGGIAGLAAAIALRQRGVDAVVLEQAPELREIGAGLLLAPNACAVLEKLGALQFLLSGRSVPVQQWELLNRNGRSLSVLKIPKDGQPSISTRRSDLQSCLLQCLPSEAVLLGCSATSARLSATGVIVSLADGRQIQAQYVIVADGSHSKLRECLWPGREPRYCGYVGWRGIVDFVPKGWRGGRVTESWGKGRRFGIAMVGDERTYWYASANVSAPQRHEQVSLAQLRRDFAGWHCPVAEILEAMPEERLLQHPISDRRPSWHWQLEEKAVLLGDAAHPLTPNLGQGASMALEDAWELGVQWGKPDAMKRFENRRRLRLQRLWASSRWLGVMIQWENPLLCYLRDTQMRAIPNSLSTNLMRRILHYVPGEAGDP